MKEKFAFFAPRFHTNQHFVVKTLLEAGHSVQFYALYRGHSEEYSILEPHVFEHAWISKFLRHMALLLKSRELDLRWVMPSLSQFLREIKRFDADVYIVRDPNYLSALLALTAGRLMGKKLIIYTQGAKYREPRFKQDLLSKTLLKLFNASWITPVKGDPGVCPFVPVPKYYIPFIVQSHAQTQRPNTGEAIRVLSIGKFIPRKNHLLLLRAMEPLMREYSLKLTVIGECTTEIHHQEYERVQAYIQENNLQEFVEIYTNLSFGDVQAMYPANDVFVLPSQNEPAAVSILEAMSYGLAVIASTTNGTSCYINQGGNGYVFQSGDVDDLREKIAQLINNPRRLEEMQAESMRLASTVHSPERYYQAILDVVGHGKTETRR